MRGSAKPRAELIIKMGPLSMMLKCSLDPGRSPRVCSMATWLGARSQTFNVHRIVRMMSSSGVRLAV